MRICETTYHDQIVYDGSKCPLCEALDTIDELRSEVKELETKVENLEDDVERLREEL